MANLQEELVRVKSKVDELILEQLLPESSQIPEVDLLYKMMRDYPARPAKGLRPFMVVATCRAMGGKEEDSLLTAACMELFQHWILIHDDIEDESELRRGQPALHRKYSEAQALNAGDALHGKMWESLLSNDRNLGQEKTLKILKEFARMVNATTEGQHMELTWVQNRRWDLHQSDYYEMCSRKTSWYTVSSPCRLGAIVAGAGEEDLALLLQFGVKLGVGFQIQDDVLNLTGDPAKYGKASSDDLLEGKRTLMLLRLLEAANAQDRARLLAIMDKPRYNKTEEDLAAVLSMMKAYGAIDFAHGRAKQLVEEALATLDKIGWKGGQDSVEMLRSVARFAVERQW